MQQTCKHNYIVVEFDGYVARKLMCSHCLEILNYKDIKRNQTKPIDGIIIDYENDPF